MSEQGTRVAHQESGSYVATRDAYELDSLGNPRVIQLIDFASRQLVRSVIRGDGTPISSADGTDLTNLPVNLTGNLLTVGDKSTLLIDTEFSADTGDVDITPVYFKSDGVTVEGIGETKTSAMGSAKFRYGAATGNYAGPRLQWDVQGAVKIGIHVTSINTGSCVVYGGMI